MSQMNQEILFTNLLNPNSDSMKTPRLTIFFLLLLFCNETNGQSAKNALFMEAGGGGLIYSLNYERTFKYNLAGRAGISFLQIRENQTEKTLNLMSFPLSLSYLQNLRGNVHFVEFGIGVMNLYTDGDLVEYKGARDFFVNPFAIAGYRYKPKGKRWDLRAGLTPFIGTKSLSNPTEQGFQPFGSKIQLWGSLGIGYSL